MNNLTSVEPMGKIEGISHDVYKYDNQMLRGGDILSLFKRMKQSNMFTVIQLKTGVEP